MKLLITISLALILSIITFGQGRGIELTKDNPSTLVSTNSASYTIFGFKLGMTRPEVQKVLASHKMLVRQQDAFNPARIYVSDKGPRGRKGKEILYLIWEPGATKLSEITIFTDCAKYLSPNFARLLTPEGISDSSAFRKTFIGNPDRLIVRLDSAAIDLKNTTYCYDKIGIEVTRVHSGRKEHVVFALVAPSEVLRAASPQRSRQAGSLPYVCYATANSRPQLLGQSCHRRTRPALTGLFRT